MSFDLAHHVTFGIDWIPSFLAFLPVPFIWGPIVGAQSVSISFRRTFPWKAQIREQMRSWIRQLSEVDPLVCLAARRAALGVASTPEAAKHLLRLGCKKVIIYPSVGMSTDEIERFSSPQLAKETNSGLRFLTVSRLLAFKGLCLALTAFSEVQRRFSQAELWIIGEGPDRRRLIRLADQLGIKDHVRFWGWLPRQKVFTLLVECDVLVYPCLRGAISMACLEAMAMGRPIICLDLGGPALQATEETGFKVPAISPEQVINDLAQAMQGVAQDPGLRVQMGQAGRKRVVEYFDWNKKGEWITAIYQEVKAGIYSDRSPWPDMAPNRGNSPLLRK
jgi:glycosyltransferase involved in cell wall biosynthesis